MKYFIGFLILFCMATHVNASYILNKIYNSNKQIQNLTYTIKIDMTNGEDNAHSRRIWKWCAITINQGMLNKIKNNHELARVVGHEISHCVLGNSVSPHDTEYTMDSYGASLASKAGYDMCKGAEYLKRRNSRGGRTHPSDIDRYRVLVHKYCH